MKEFAPIKVKTVMQISKNITFLPKLTNKIPKMGMTLDSAQKI